MNEELKTLARLVPTAPVVPLLDEQDPMYCAGYANGYADCMREVMEILEAEPE